MADVSKALNQGLDFITGLILGAGAVEPHHVGWGIAVAAADAADTGLKTASEEARTAGTGSQQTTTTLNDTYQVLATIVCATASKNITEVATYTAATGGTATIRSTFDPVGVSVADSIAFTIKTVLDQA